MIELLTTAEMAETDRLAIAGGVAGIDLMENAGREVARSVDHHLDRHVRGKGNKARIIVIAGPGNNGGDGFVAARHLAQSGHRVRILFAGNAGRLRGDATLAAKRWKGGIERAQPDAIRNADIIVDALFGAGLDRPIEGEAHDLISAMNASALPIYAVDLPSGINGTTGAVMGCAIQASGTVTFFRRKPGHLLLPGRLHCGTITVADIGIPASTLAAIKPQTFVNERELWGTHIPVPRLDGHKYSRGHAVVVSGGVSSTGAARLAARGALRAGAGLVTIASPREALAVNAATNLAVMVRPVDGPGELAEFLGDARKTVVVLGPGGGVGPAMRELVSAALAGPRAVVLDADALTSFADDPGSLVAAIERRAGATTVLTPHDGEFKSMFKSLNGFPQAGSRLERARWASGQTDATVVLKGADTVVAMPDGRAAITENAPAWLATAGSGDVLAGFVAGLLAQGMPAFEAAAAAVWLHGEAGNKVGPGLISEDLPEALPQVYRRLYDA